jgi:hypothetical protein
MKERILRKLDRLIFSKWRALLTLSRRTNLRRWEKNTREVPTWDARNRLIRMRWCPPASRCWMSERVLKR